jgi:hypothetical protein
MNQLEINKYFRSSLGEQCYELFSTSDDRVFVRYEEAVEHSKQNNLPVDKIERWWEEDEEAFFASNDEEDEKEDFVFVLYRGEEEIDRTSIDENNMNVARDLFIEFGHDLTGCEIELEH